MSLLSLPCLLSSSTVKLQTPPHLFVPCSCGWGLSWCSREHRVLLQGHSSILPGCATGAKVNQCTAEALSMCFSPFPFVTVIPPVRLDTHLCCSDQPALGRVTWGGSSNSAQRLERQGWSQLEEVPNQLLSLISCVGHRSSPADTSGVRATKVPWLAAAHLTEDAPLLRLCQGDPFGFFCGGVCEPRRRTQMLINRKN